MRHSFGVGSLTEAGYDSARADVRRQICNPKGEARCIPVPTPTANRTTRN